MKEVTFSVFRDSFTNANIGLTDKGTTNVAFFSHFNIFTLRSFIFFKDGFEKEGTYVLYGNHLLVVFPGMFANQMDCARDSAGRACWTFHLE